MAIVCALLFSCNLAHLLYADRLFAMLGPAGEALVLASPYPSGARLRAAFRQIDLA